MVHVTMACSLWFMLPIPFVSSCALMFILTLYTLRTTSSTLIGGKAELVQVHFALCLRDQRSM